MLNACVHIDTENKHECVNIITVIMVQLNKFCIEVNSPPLLDFFSEQGTVINYFAQLI